MPFFEPLPDRPTYEAEDFDEPWYQPGDRVVGGIVPLQIVVAETERVAVVVSHLAIDPGGLTLTLTVVRRKAAGERTDLHHRGGDLGDEGLRFGLGLADGTVVERLPDWAPDRQPTAWTLAPRGGSGSNARTDQELRLEPAPPPGPVTVACVWPDLGVAESTAVVDGAVLATALDAARVLWPDDPDEPMPEDRWFNVAPNRGTIYESNDGVDGEARP